jgi:hypothetical protein
MTVQVKDHNVRRFDQDPTCLEMISSMEAGSEGCDMDGAEDVGICQLPWTPKTLEQAEDRAYGRKHNPHGITSWIFLAPGTIDDHVLAINEKKLHMASTIQDGRAADRIVSQKIDDDLLDAYRQRWAA